MSWAASPDGTVQLGADFDRVCDELRDALRELRDPATGALLVHDVLRADEIAPGPAPQDLADLHVVWNDTGPLRAASSPRVGEVHVELPPLRPGNHVEGGWFVAAGPGIGQGTSTVRCRRSTSRPRSRASWAVTSSATAPRSPGSPRALSGPETGGEPLLAADFERGRELLERLLDEGEVRDVAEHVVEA